MTALAVAGKLRPLMDALPNITEPALKVKLAYEYIVQSNLLPYASDVRFPKDEDKAIVARNEGNQHFAAGNLAQALECYNRSLCFCFPYSENLSIAYANRSAVYLRSGHYKHCLDNIQKALDNNYPDRLTPKLLERKAQCVTRMKEINNNKNKGEVPPYEAKLSFESHPNIPHMANAIALAANDKYGRHLVAKIDLKPGEIVMVEDPFVKVLEYEMIYSNCMYCFKDNCMNLIPCLISTHVMFCSMECHNEAWRGFYKYEAPITAALHELFNENHDVMTVRILLMGFALFNDLDRFMEYIGTLKSETNPKTGCDIDYNTATTGDIYGAIYGLSKNEALRLPKAQIEAATTSAVLFHILKTYTDLKDKIKTKEHELFLKELLHHFSLLKGINSMGMTARLPTPVWDTNRLSGRGIFPISSFLSHSCAPNILRAVESRNILVVMRPIKAGTPLFDSYLGGTHGRIKKTDRQVNLALNYQFKCDCIACEHDFPLKYKLPVRRLNIMDIDVMSPNWRQDYLDLEYVKRMLQNCNRFLLEYANEPPSFEYYMVEQVQHSLCGALFFSFHVDMGLKPLSIVD